MLPSAPSARIARIHGAVNLGSFRISAIIAGETESGELVVLGSAHRASQGVRRGYVTDMAAATYAVRDAIERAEKMANTAVSRVWIGCSGAGLASHVVQAELEIGGRRIEDEDVDHLLFAARDMLQPDGRIVLHAQAAHYTLDGAHGVASPRGLHAERLGVDIHVMLAEGAPVRNLTEAVQSAHLEVEGVVASPLATGHAVLSPEERELGVALVEVGAEVTNVGVFAGGMLVGLASIPAGSADITDAVASAFGIRRAHAERLKCVSGSAVPTPSDHREMIPVVPPGEEHAGTAARMADEQNRIPRAELIGVIASQVGRLSEDINKALRALGFSGSRGQQVVLTGGGGAELVGLADHAQQAFGRAVRIGRAPALQGLPETHLKPGFATLAGLVLYAAADPLDIRAIDPGRHQRTVRHVGRGLAGRVLRAAREYF